MDVSRWFTAGYSFCRRDGLQKVREFSGGFVEGL